MCLGGSAAFSFTADWGMNCSDAPAFNYNTYIHGFLLSRGTDAYYFLRNKAVLKL